MQEQFNNLIHAIDSTDIEKKHEISEDLAQLQNELLNKIETDPQSYYEEILVLKGKITAELEDLLQLDGSLISKIDAYRDQIEHTIRETKQQLDTLAGQVEQSQSQGQTFRDKWNPFKAKNIGSRKKKVGTSVLQFLGVATLIPSVSGSSWFTAIEQQIKEWAGLFIPKSNRPSPERLVLEDLSDEGLVDYLEKRTSNFKEKKLIDRLSSLDRDALILMSKLIEQYPDIRITSTVRTQEENNALALSAENSAHMYGLAFDIGKSSAYSLSAIQNYIDQSFSNTKTLIHGEGDLEHLHVKVDKPLLAENKFVQTEAEII